MTTSAWVPLRCPGFDWSPHVWPTLTCAQGHCNGFILNNYAPGDRLAQVARLAVGSSVVCTFPLTFSTLRDTLRELLGSRAPSRNLTTLALISVISLLGAAVKDLGALVSVTGALISTSIAYILPNVMFGQLRSAQLKAAQLAVTSGKRAPIDVRRLRIDLVIARVISLLGMALVSIGLYAAALRRR